MIHPVARKPKRVLAKFVVSAVLLLNLNTNLMERSSILSEHRGLTRALENGGCSIEPVAEFKTPDANATRTLLTSYPGSGKRFAWLIMSALTNYDVADDWDFPGNLNENVLTLKTSFPNPNGIWSWENQMNQVVLLLRNPRWAIPSFHTMRYELDFADDWLSSFYRIPYIYTERPSVALWNSWRDANFDIELQAYVDHLEFWMQGGLEAETGNISPYCADNDIDCRPKAVIDFDNFYKENPDVDFFQLAGILDKTYNSTAVEMLAASARVCALDKVYEKTDLRHNNNRQGSGPTAQEFLFTSTQLQTMQDKVTEVRDKYDALAQGDVNSLEHELVAVLDKYIAEINGEKTLMLQVETGY